MNVNNGSGSETDRAELPVDHALLSEHMADALSEEDRAELNELMTAYAYHAKKLSAAKSKISHHLNSGRFTVDQQRTLNAIDTGVDTSKADIGALVQLLIEKGVFTQTEYFEVALDFMDREGRKAQTTFDRLEGTLSRSSPE